MHIALVLTALTVLSQASAQDESKQQKSFNKRKDVSQQSQTQSAIELRPNQSNPHYKNTTASSESYDSPGKSFWGDAPTWGLFIVSIFDAGVAIYTLLDIRDQTRTLINSERAWIMVDVEHVPGMGGIMDGSSSQMGVGQVRAESTAFRARIICKNDGKAPAWITEKQAGLDIVDSVPEIPDWSRTKSIQVALEPLSVGQVGKPSDETLICKRGRALGKTTILYGIVKYRDPFGEHRNTTFGYMVRDDGTLERLQNAKYNENT